MTELPTFLTVDAVTDDWKSISSNYSDSVLLAAMQTTNGSNTADVRMTPDGSRSWRIRLEEEASRDDETRHTEEKVGLLEFPPGSIKDSDGNHVGEVGTVEVDQPNGWTWHSIELPDGFSFDNTVLAMQILTFKGPQPVHPRIRREGRETGEPGFHFQLEEWPTYDLVHVREKVGWVILKHGFHQIRFPEDPHIDVGLLDSVSVDWHRPVQYGGDIYGSGTPVVVSQCQTYNGGQAVVTRHKDADLESFKVRLQEAEIQGGYHKNEEVAYIAMGIPFF